VQRSCFSCVVWDTGHAGVELRRLLAVSRGGGSSDDTADEYGALGGRRRRALVLSCGTGSDAILLLEKGFKRVACVEICSLALLQGIAKLWRRMAEKGYNAHIVLVRGDGRVEKWGHPAPEAVPAMRKTDPRIEFYEQDNLALAQLWQRTPAAGPRHADLIYDNSAYNNLRNRNAFPGALGQYFTIVSRLLSPKAGLLHIVSGDVASKEKIAYFPEHDRTELLGDLSSEAPSLELVDGFPRGCTYDFATAHPGAARGVAEAGGTRGWSTLLWRRRQQHQTGHAASDGDAATADISGRRDASAKADL
jgi:hypothetical protein